MLCMSCNSRHNRQSQGYSFAFLLLTKRALTGARLLRDRVYAIVGRSSFVTFVNYVSHSRSNSDHSQLPGKEIRVVGHLAWLSFIVDGNITEYSLGYKLALGFV